MELMVIQQSLALVAALAVAQCLALLCVSQCALAAAKSAHMVFAALRRCLLIRASRYQWTMGPRVSQSLFQCEVIVMLIALWASDSRNQLDKNQMTSAPFDCMMLLCL